MQARERPPRNSKKRSLRFVTWNTCGIRTPPEKLSTLLKKLSTLEAAIVFIQETHIGPKCDTILQQVKGWRVFFTVHSPRSKGVAILISDNVSFEYICHDEDYSGGYIVLFCHLYGQLFTLVNVYNHKADREVLIRLKDYLMETAEGVLVVGGDFNTVLDPAFDRDSSALQAGQSALRAILETFTNSLNLTEVWSNFHPRDKDFTRSQKDSFSRLDMFFMPQDTMHSVSTCDINTTANNPKISDHHPLILTLSVQQQTEKKMPKVASMLEEFGYRQKTDRRPEKINGAEILSAIKSLTDSGEQRPDRLKVEHYRMFSSPMTEILKINYNLMLSKNSVCELFKRCSHSKRRRIYNVDYLIFSLILAKRLKVFLTPSFRSRKKPKLDLSISVTFADPPRKVNWDFLEKSLKLIKVTHPAPPRSFRILKDLLPKVRHGDKVRCLDDGCPLTTPILTLVLNQLKSEIESFGIANTRVCHFRKALLIHTDMSDKQIREHLQKFIQKSGIKLCHEVQYRKVKY